MVYAAVDNHDVENLQDPLSTSHHAGAACSAQRAKCTCYVVKRTWRREDVTVAAHKAFFRLQRNQIRSLGVFWLL